MAIKKGDFVTYKGEKNADMYGQVADLMQGDDEPMAKVQTHTLADDGSLTPQDDHTVMPVAKLRSYTPKKGKGDEGKSLLIPFSDDGDPFKEGDYVVFDGNYDQSPASFGNYVCLGVIRAINGQNATVECLDVAMQPTGNLQTRPLVNLREYVLPGMDDEEDDDSTDGEGKSATAGKMIIEITGQSRIGWSGEAEYKSIAGVDQSVNGRTVDGIAAVFGNVDDVDDITHKGAFSKTLQDQGGRVMFTFNHEITDIPRARIDELKEINRTDLPPQIKAKYPQATGGLFVRRTYLETPRGEEAYQAVINRAVKEMSYGFQAMKKDFGKIEGKTVRNLREVRLIDVCDTTLGVNPAAMARKSALPYHETPKASEDAAWDGPAEVAKASVDDLKAMCAWVDSENADDKGAYKLPHHEAEGDHAVVWKGVSAAMAALLGSRGGVDIPDGDRRAVYNHLAKHYAQFSKDVPDFKSVEIIWSVQDARKLLLQGVDFKMGRTISAANESKIRDVIDTITKQLESLEELLGTAEPPPDEGEKALTSHLALSALLDMAEIEAQLLRED